MLLITQKTHRDAQQTTTAVSRYIYSPPANVPIVIRMALQALGIIYLLTYLQTRKSALSDTPDVRYWAYIITYRSVLGPKLRNKI